MLVAVVLVPSLGAAAVGAPASASHAVAGNSVWTPAGHVDVGEAVTGIDVDPTTGDVVVSHVALPCWAVDPCLDPEPDGAVSRYSATGAPLGTPIDDLVVNDQPGTMGPQAVAVGPDGHLFVVAHWTRFAGGSLQAGGGLDEYEPDGTFVNRIAPAYAFNAPLFFPGEISLAASVDVAADGSLVVGESYRSRIERFDSDGNYLADVLDGSAVALDGAMFQGALARFPESMGQAVAFAPDGDLWVSSGSTGTIRKVDLDTGSTSMTLAMPAVAWDLDVDPAGRLHVLVKGGTTHEVRTYAADGQLVDSLVLPPIADPLNGGYELGARLAVSPVNGNLYVALGDEVHIFEPAGTGPVDTDGDDDGLDDAVDADPATPSAVFDDGSGTSGELLNGTEDTVVTDLAAPEGVAITVGGTTGTATLRVCGAFTLALPAGSSVRITCGSITIAVDAGGPAVITPDGDGVTTITVPAGVTARVTTPVNDDVTVEHVAGDGRITVDVGGVSTTVRPGEPATFSTNVAPVVTSVTVPAPSVALGAAAVVTASFTDQGAGDSHTCTVVWGDGSTTGPVAASGGGCSASRTYPNAGVYTVTVTVTDDAGDADSAIATLVVHDPAGSVTGAGSIDAPAGAAPARPTAAGTVTVAVVAAYPPRAATPIGAVTAASRTLGLDFRSTSLSWLVVTPAATAQLSGTGTVNGQAGYRFVMWANDGRPDTMRIRIWRDTPGGTTTVVFDNGSAQRLVGKGVVVRR